MIDDIRYVGVCVSLDGWGSLGVKVVGPYDTHIEALAAGELVKAAGQCQWVGFDVLSKPDE